MSSVRILVCGSRTWTDKARIWLVLDEINRPPKLIDAIIHGGAKGADTFAAEWVRYQNENMVEPNPVELAFPISPEDWARHRRGAGPIRNQRMLDEGRPTMVLAFRSEGQSPGTDDMIRRASKAGIDVRILFPLLSAEERIERFR